jgi:hypothetical protein
MKRSLIRIALVTFGLLCLYASLPAQTYTTVTVSAANLMDGGTGGVPVPANGIISFKPVLATGIAGSYIAPGGGIVSIAPVSTTVTGGAFTMTLPDVEQTTPPGICFSATLSTNHGSVLGPGYTCVQPHGTPTGSSDWCQYVSGTSGPVKCNFDNLEPVYTPAQTAFPALPPAPDMVSMWNSLVDATIAGGGSVGVSTLTDASTVAWSTTNPAMNAANLFLFTCGTSLLVPQPTPGQPGCYPSVDGIAARTVNVSGMTVNARYMLMVMPYTIDASAGAQAVTMGSGCTWQWTQGNVIVNGNSFTIPAWSRSSYLVVWIYDGTNCNATVVN